MPGGETEEKPSAFTVDSLKVLLEHEIGALRRELTMQIIGNDKRYEDRFTAQQEAIRLSDAATEARLASVNEFRATLADQAANLMPRSEAEQRTAQNSARIGALEQSTAERFAGVNSRLDLNAGRSTGLEKGWGVLIGAAGFVGAVVAVVIALGR